MVQFGCRTLDLLLHLQRWLQSDLQETYHFSSSCGRMLTDMTLPLHVDMLRQTWTLLLLLLLLLVGPGLAQSPTTVFTDGTGPADEDTECVFPFTYRGGDYPTCTDTRHDTYWCATTREYDGQWGNCQPRENCKSLCLIESLHLPCCDAAEIPLVSIVAIPWAILPRNPCVCVGWGYTIIMGSCSYK